MWPVLFEVFGVQVQSYGASKAIAAVVGALLLGRRFLRLGYDKDIAYSLVMWATVWGFVAAKVYFLLDNLDHFELHMLGSSGFVWYGGLVGGTLAVVVITRRHKLPLATVAGSMAMPLSVAYGIGRIGCFLAGDGTYGKPTDLPWGMAFPNGAVPINVPVHPAQLYEAAAAFLIAVALWYMQDRLSPASVFGSYLLLSGIARILVEFVRVNNPVLLGLTEAQLLGFASVVIGAALIVRYRKGGLVDTPEPSTAPAAVA